MPVLVCKGLRKGMGINEQILTFLVCLKIHSSFFVDFTPSIKQSFLSLLCDFSNFLFVYFFSRFILTL